MSETPKPVWDLSRRPTAEGAEGNRVITFPKPYQGPAPRLSKAQLNVIAAILAQRLHNLNEAHVCGVADFIMHRAYENMEVAGFDISRAQKCDFQLVFEALCSALYRMMDTKHRLQEAAEELFSDQTAND